MDDLLADFLTETNENLAELDLALVTLERTPDDAATLALIFRMVHTIKGTCGFLGLPRLERVAHAGESVLGKVRDGAITVTPELISLVLTALDRVKAILTGLAVTGTEPDGDDAPLIAALEATAAGKPAPQAATPHPDAKAILPVNYWNNGEFRDQLDFKTPRPKLPSLLPRGQAARSRTPVPPPTPRPPIRRSASPSRCSRT